MRRASELSHVSGMTQIGIRNVSSSAREDYTAAKAAGSEIISVREARRLGVAALAEKIPADCRYYCTIDIDGFDPSIAPGTGTPSHGGFLYYEVIELLKTLAKRGRFVGVDLVGSRPGLRPGGGDGNFGGAVVVEFHRCHFATQSLKSCALSRLI